MTTDGHRRITDNHKRLIFLNMHWGDFYEFSLPEAPAFQWVAVAKFGARDQVIGQSSADLLELVRAHWGDHRDQARAYLARPRPVELAGFHPLRLVAPSRRCGGG